MVHCIVLVQGVQQFFLNFQRLYSIYSYKTLAIFSVLYNRPCSLFILYVVVCTS